MPTDKKRALYEALYMKKEFGGTYEAFNEAFSSEDNVASLYDKLVEKEAFSGTPEEFHSTFFPDVKKKEDTEVLPEALPVDPQKTPEELESTSPETTSQLPEDKEVKDQEPVKKPEKLSPLAEKVRVDVDKWYADRGGMSPVNKINTFSRAVDDARYKYERILAGDPEKQEEINAQFQEEISGFADQYGLSFKDGKVSLLQTDIDKYKEITERYGKLAEKEAKEKGEKGFLESAMYKLGAGAKGQVLNIPVNLMAISEKLTNVAAKPLGKEQDYWTNLAEYHNQVAGEMSEEGTKYEEDLVTLVKSGEMGKAVGKTALDAVQSIPMLITLASGNAVGATNITLGLMGGSKGAQEYLEMSKDPSIPEWSRLIGSVTKAANEVGFELMGTVPILNSLKRSVAEAGEDVVRKEIYKALQPKLHRTMAVLNKGTSNAVKEGATEMATEIADNAVDISQGKDIQLFDNAADAGAAGFMIGKGISLPTYIKTDGQAKKYARDLIKAMPEDMELETKIEIAELVIKKDIVSEKAEKAPDNAKKVFDAEQKDLDSQIEKVVSEQVKEGLVEDDTAPLYQIGEKTFETKEEFLSEIEKLKGQKDTPEIKIENDEETAKKAADILVPEEVETKEVTEPEVKEEPEVEVKEEVEEEPVEEVVEKPTEKSVKERQHNSLLDMVKQYNKIPKTHKNKRAQLNQPIANLAKELGYQTALDPKTGKMVIKDDAGKTIGRKLGKPIPEKAIEATEQEDQFVNDFIENMQLEDVETEGERVDFDMSNAEIKKGLADIKAGKSTVPATRLKNNIISSMRDGAVPMIAGTGGTAVRTARPVEDVIESFETIKEEITPEQDFVLKNLPQQLIDRVDEEGITLENIDEIRDAELKEMKGWFPEETIKETEEDYNLLKQYLQDESKRKPTEKAKPVSKEEPVIEKGQRIQPEQKPKELTAIEDKIADKKSELSKVRKAREKKFAEMDERRGLFGDTKETTEPKLFETEFEATKETFKEALKDYDGQIRKLTEEIDKLEKDRKRIEDKTVEQLKIEPEDQEFGFAEPKKKPGPKKKRTVGDKKKADQKKKDTGVGKVTPKEEKRTRDEREERKDWIDEEKLDNSDLKGIQIPELIGMVQKLIGMVPKLKNFRTSLGKFYHKKGKAGEIGLDRRLFKEENRDLLAKVLAHEIGHLIDSLPDHTMSRGNILGRIASLKEYTISLLKEAEAAPGEALTPKDRAKLRRQAEKELKEEYDKGIREIVEEVIKEVPIYDEAGLTADDILAIWRDTNSREKNPELYEYIAKLRPAQKRDIVKDAMKGLIDSEIVRKYSKAKQIGTKTVKETIRKIIIPDPATKENISKKYAELLKDEINKRRLFEAEIITQELKDLTQWWNPFDTEQDKNYTKYRHSAVELYAEALSVLLNKPQEVAERAPYFNRAFFNYFGKKSSVKEVYDELQELMKQPQENIIEKRVEETKEEFKKGEIERKEGAKKEKPKYGLFDTLGKILISTNIPYLRSIPKGRTLKKELGRRERMRNIIEKSKFVTEQVGLFLKDTATKVEAPLTEAGIDINDFGVILKNERIMTQRKDVANPDAFSTPEAAAEIAKVREKYSEEQLKKMDRIKKVFHELIFQVTEDLYNVGGISTETFEDIILPNKEVYATFTPLEYIRENYISPLMHEVKGTLKKIGNPFVQTTLKAAAMIKMTERQILVNAIRDDLQKNNPDEIKIIRPKRGNVPMPERGKGHIDYYEDGKRVVMEVDKYVADIVNLEKDLMSSIAGTALDFLATPFRIFNLPFKLLVTTWNVSWAFYSNVFRDQPRTFKNMVAILMSTEGLSKSEAISVIKDYIPKTAGSRKEAKAFVKGEEITSLIREMIKEGVLSKGFFGSYDSTANDSLEHIFKKYGLLSKGKTLRDYMKAASLITRAPIAALEFIEYRGSRLEALPKITAYRIFKERLGSKEAAAFYTRNYAGTPNFMDKGDLTRWVNTIMPFSNVILQAIRTDSSIAFRPQTRSAYWVHTAITTVFPAVLTALASAGLLGDDLKKYYDQITDYDKSNFLPIPVGIKNGVIQYIRMPMDEFRRLIYSMTYTMVKTMAEKDISPKDVERILHVGTGMLPTSSPIFTIKNAWAQYLQGNNPFDPFYGENILSQKEQSARGIDAFGKMVGWTIKKSGGYSILRMFDYDPLRETTKEYILKNIPIYNRAIRTGGKGLQEKYIDEAKKVRRERAKDLIAQDKVVNNQVRKYIREFEEYSPRDAKDYYTELRKEIYGDRKLTKDEVNKFRYVKIKFKNRVLKGMDTPYDYMVDALIASTSNAEKERMVELYNEANGPSDTMELLKDMYGYELLSKSLYSNLSRKYKKLAIEE
jgi:hypothetical protein